MLPDMKTAMGWLLSSGIRMSMRTVLTAMTMRILKTLLLRICLYGSSLPRSSAPEIMKNRGGPILVMIEKTMTRTPDTLGNGISRKCE